MLDPKLRVPWLRSELSQLSGSEAALLLDSVMARSELGEPNPRQAAISIVMLIAGSDEPEILDELREQARKLKLLSLDRLVRRDPNETEPVLGHLDLPVPDYGRDRELTLGERRSLARIPNRRSFPALLRDPHPMVTELLLNNPKTIEEDIMRLVTARPARPDTIRSVAGNFRWLTRERIRMSIILNPGSPACIAVPLVSLCNRAALKYILKSTHISATIETVARELVARRPPIPNVDGADSPTQ